MIVREREYKECPSCHRRELVRDEAYGCDACGMEIDLSAKRNNNYLDITVFRHDTESEPQHLHYCSWKCLFDALPKIRTDYFVSLPYISYDDKSKRTGKNAFFAELKKKKK